MDLHSLQIYTMQPLSIH